MKAAGNSLKEPLRLSYNEGANWDKVATIMVGNLKEAGIDAKLDPFPADGTYFSKMRKGGGQIIRAGWFADYVLYDNFMFPLLHKASIDGDNLERYNSDTFSGLVDKARGTADLKAAGNTYADAEKQALSTDVVIIPTVNRSNNSVFGKNIRTSSPLRLASSTTTSSSSLRDEPLIVCDGDPKGSRRALSVLLWLMGSYLLKRFAFTIFVAVGGTHHHVFVVGRHAWRRRLCEVEREGDRRRYRGQHSSQVRAR